MEIKHDKITEYISASLKYNNTKFTAIEYKAKVIGESESKLENICCPLAL